MLSSNIGMATTNPFECKYECSPPVIANKNMPFDGNVTNSSISRAMRYSQLVRGKGKNYGSYAMIYNTINAFGYYAGGPGGSGAAPKNAF
jgi:hypothetical protein